MQDQKVSELEMGPRVDTPVSSKDQKTDVIGPAVIETDAVFGEITADGPNYRSVGWISTSVLMIKTQMGLGVLSLPSILGTLGMVPGLICIFVIGFMATWGDWVIGQCKKKYPQVYCIDDMGYLMFGRVGREVMAFASWLFMVFVAGAGMLSLSVCLNALSLHGTCTAVFVAVSAVAAALIASIQTLGKIKFIGWAGVISIFAALLVLVIACGVQDRPARAPQTGDWDKGLVIFGSPKFSEACAAVSGIVLSFAGAPTYFPMASEMKDPRLFTRAVILSQAIVIAVYMVIGAVVYYFVGQYVASPALGSAGVVMKRVCYGLALPGLLVSTVLYAHLPAKYLFVRILRGSEHLSKNTVKHWVVWLSSVIGCILFSYVVASAIPVFGGLVNLIGASLGTLVCIQAFGAFWLWDNWSRPVRTTGWYIACVWSVFMIVSGMFLMGAGTYGSVVSVIDEYKASGGSAAWTCADNSNSS